MVIAEQVKDTVNEECVQLRAPRPPKPPSLTGRRGERDHHIAQQRHPRSPHLTLREREHVGGAVHTPVAAVERAHLGIVDECDAQLRPAQAQRAEGPSALSAEVVADARRRSAAIVNEDGHR